MCGTALECTTLLFPKSQHPTSTQDPDPEPCTVGTKNPQTVERLTGHTSYLREPGGSREVSPAARTKVLQFQEDPEGTLSHRTKHRHYIQGDLTP